MSNKPRCHDCNHQRGPRSTAPMSKANDKPGDVHEAQPAKTTCACACHITVKES